MELYTFTTEKKAIEILTSITKQPFPNFNLWLKFAEGGGKEVYRYENYNAVFKKNFNLEPYKVKIPKEIEDFYLPIIQFKFEDPTINYLGEFQIKADFYNIDFANINEVKFSNPLIQDLTERMGIHPDFIRNCLIFYEEKRVVRLLTIIKERGLRAPHSRMWCFHPETGAPVIYDWGDSY